jgi:glycosyltransferase involved in cell wall biosynthesis
MVDVIIPVFNSENYISYCINSVISQNNVINVYCINDGSTDFSGVILKRFSDKYKNIHVIDQSNQKQSIARNNGIMNSKSKYIALLDSDDQWTPNHLQLCLDELEKNNCDIVSTGFFDSYEVGDMLLDISATIHPVFPGIYAGECGINKFIMSNKVATSTVVMRREVIEKIGFFDPIATPAEDYDLWIRAIKSGFKVKVLSEATMYYRHHEKSSTSNSKPRWSFNEDFDVLNKNFTIRQLQSLPFEVEKSLALKFKYWVRFSSESFILRKKFFYLVKFAGRTLDIKLLILFILRFLKLIQHNKLNISITSRINIFYLSE